MGVFPIGLTWNVFDAVFYIETLVVFWSFNLRQILRFDGVVKQFALRAAGKSGLKMAVCVLLNPQGGENARPPPPPVLAQGGAYVRGVGVMG